MADDLTALDPAALRAFAEHDVQGFHKDLVDMRISTGDRKSLYDIAGEPSPVHIGALADDGETAGKTVVTNLTKAAAAIDAVFNAHASAFADLRINLLDVIAAMQKAQADSLQKFESAKFLTAIAPYESGLNGGNGSDGSGSSSSS
ncbi:type VII secretion system-associated protein [Streptomyces sp. NPDC002740]